MIEQRLDCLASGLLQSERDIVMTTDAQSTPANRAIKDAAKDRTLADELHDAANLQELHTLCRRLIDERETLARGFNATIQAWSLVDASGGRASDPDAVAAIERIATEAIQFAREVVQAMTRK